MLILNVVKVAEAIVGFINPFEMEQKDSFPTQTTFSNLIVLSDQRTSRASPSVLK
jgi:hypothetical protein